MQVHRGIRLFLYYTVLKYLPPSYVPVLGKLSKKLRYLTCWQLFHTCAKSINIEAGAYFGDGTKISLGEHSGLGMNCHIQGGAIIGDNVMMAPNVTIIRTSHDFSRCDIPMRLQGKYSVGPLVVENDVWIGRNVTILPGCRKIATGVIIGSCSVVTKDVPEYAIIAGNPAKIIRMRKSP